MGLSLSVLGGLSRGFLEEVEQDEELQEQQILAQQKIMTTRGLEALKERNERKKALSLKFDELSAFGIGGDAASLCSSFK